MDGVGSISARMSGQFAEVKRQIALASFAIPGQLYLPRYEPRRFLKPSGRILHLHQYILPVPLVSDEIGYVVFETELEAQKEIVDNQMTRLRQFLNGEREYEDAITVEEYIVPVTGHPDGVFVDEDGRCFGPKPD